MKKYKEKNRVDMSHSDAKRYSIDYVLDEPLPKEEMREIILEEMGRFKGEIFHRNRLCKIQWGNTPPHVIWLGFLLNEEDSEYFCDALWIADELDPKYHPTSLFNTFHGIGDNEVYDGIEIVWATLTTDETWIKSKSN